MRHTLAAASLLAFAFALASPASAIFHLMRIVQVYGGDVSHPDAQYVVLQMCLAGQNQVQGRDVGFFDAAGAAIGVPVVFPAAVGNSASQARILLATSSTETLFGVVADLRMPASLLTAGGKVCFEPGVSPVDCFGWGAYTALPDATIGTPYDAGVGLPAGQAVQRDLAIAGDPMMLDCLTPNFDDTNNSAADFDPTSPAPVNNGNVAGVINVDHVFVHGFEAGATAGWSSVVP